MAKHAAKPDISVVIPTHQRSNLLAPLLDALKAQSLPADRFEVIFVDDCSTDDTVQQLERRITDMPFEMRVLRTHSNRGPAVARNIGWRNARADLFAFLDDDCTPDRNWLEAGLAALLDNPGAGVIQGRTEAPEAEYALPNITGGPPDWYVWRIVRESTPYFEALNIFYRREAFEETGGFDEEIGWWGEDTAAGWRVLEGGWTRDFAHDALAIHPVEHRGWNWYVRNGLIEHKNIQLAAMFPGFRDESQWRSWAVRPDCPAFVLALVGVLLARRFRPALLLLVPYVVKRRPSVRHASFLRLCFQIPIVDAAQTIGHLRGSIENGIFVL